MNNVIFDEEYVIGFSNDLLIYFKNDLIDYIKKEDYEQMYLIDMVMYAKLFEELKEKYSYDDLLKVRISEDGVGFIIRKLVEKGEQK